MKIYNFSAGPALLPPPVMQQAQAEFLDYKGTGMSLMEVSHRSDIFQDVIDRAKASLIQLMEIPEDYEVLFVQGGASQQFGMIPLNLFRKKKAAYIDTGSWSTKAIAEAERYGSVAVLASSKDQNFTYIPEWEDAQIPQDADYLHITTNNTIFGTRFSRLPHSPIPLVADMSSNILSERYDVSQFGVIYAGAQKNIGPSGVTIIIIRKDLIGHALAICPKMLNYQTHAEKGSMFNTPPTYAIYMAGLVFDWTLAQGGVAQMEKRNQEKAHLLYDYLDSSPHFQATVSDPHRSRMNICFSLPSKEQDQQFLAFAEKEGLRFLKGHRSVGGMRASLYNPMPIEGVQRLVEVMEAFESGL
ncbi:MAG: 3-phosphoserine/phosphohydroxythreonine transaminase [Bacteroidota bacterium]